MKKTIQMLLRCGIMLVALVIPLRYLTDLLERKDSVIQYQSFFEQEADFDVLFMGLSHMTYGVLPMESWRDYGIISYNLGVPGCQIPTVYWMLKNALDYTSPKLVVIDCLYLSLDIKHSADFSAVYTALDAFPLSRNKIAAVFDLLNDPVMNELIEKGEAVGSENRNHLGPLWNFSMYHWRWNEGAKDWFEPEISREKGARRLSSVSAPNPPVEESVKEMKLAGDTVNIDYLKRMIAECQSRNIDVLLVYLPFPADATQWQEANRAYDIAKEYGLNYINFLNMDVVDFSTDCADADSHLNDSGARKVTNFLGRYIMEHYDIADQRNNAQYAGWYDDYEAYKADKLQYLQAQRNLDTYLMLLADRDYDALIEIDDPALWEKEEYVNLIRNLGADMSQSEGQAGFIVIDGGERTAQCLWCDPSQDGVYDTILGELCIKHDEERVRGVALDGVQCMTAYPDDGTSIRIRVLDMDKGERLESATFSFAMQERLGEYELSEPVRH